MQYVELSENITRTLVLIKFRIEFIQRVSLVQLLISFCPCHEETLTFLQSFVRSWFVYKETENH